MTAVAHRYARNTAGPLETAAVENQGRRARKTKGRSRRPQHPTKRAKTQRWRALKRGLDLQITKTLPRRRTTLQSRCRFFADLRDESTFMACLGASIEEKTVNAEL